MGKDVVIILAHGFEEIEALSSADVLRRAEINVTLAGLDDEFITGSRGITVKTDRVFDDSTLFDAVILPGGLPGAENLASSEKVKAYLRKMNAEKKLICAICASPALVLAPAGILDGKKATCYPGFEDKFPEDAEPVEDKVVQDGNIITSRGPATALEFALKITENLAGEDKADAVAQGMLFEG